MTSLRDAIFAAPVPSKAVDLPEWGITVYLRSLTGITRMELLDVIAANGRAVEDYNADQALDEAERQNLPKVVEWDYTVLRLIWAMHDGEGNRVFTLDDHDRFSSFPYPVMVHLYNELQSLDTRADYDALKKTSN